MPRRAASILVVGGVLALTALAGCGAVTRGGAGGRLSVVAAENVWGSLATQLGGDRVEVTDIISSPSTDPHDYEPSPDDARTVAQADVVILNGAGYDPWATQLLEANGGGPLVLDVGRLVGVNAGGNPHRWYAPADVHAVIDRITAAYEQLRPADAAYFAAQRQTFLTSGLATYDELVAAIKSRFAGTAVGASESIFAPLASALGLRVLTPNSYLNAISEGSEPSAKDRVSVEHQIAGREIAVLVFNRQNATPDVQRLVDAARAAGIPVATITETLTPAGTTFQAWQAAQLQALDAALAQGTQR